MTSHFNSGCMQSSHTNFLYFLPPSYTACKQPPHHKSSINYGFTFDTHNNKSPVKRKQEKLSHNSRVPCVFLSLGYWLCGVLHNLPVSVKVYFMSFCFLQPTKNMAVCGLAFASNFVIRHLIIQPTESKEISQYINASTNINT